MDEVVRLVKYNVNLNDYIYVTERLTSFPKRANRYLTPRRIARLFPLLCAAVFVTVLGVIGVVLLIERQIYHYII